MRLCMFSQMYLDGAIILQSSVTNGTVIKPFISEDFSKAFQSSLKNLTGTLKRGVKSDIISGILWAIAGTIVTTGIVTIACLCRFKKRNHTGLFSSHIFAQLNRKFFNMKHCKTMKKITIKVNDKKIEKKLPINYRGNNGDIVRGAPDSLSDYTHFKIFYTENSGFEAVSTNV